MGIKIIRGVSASEYLLCLKAMVRGRLASPAGRLYLWETTRSGGRTMGTTRLMALTVAP